jgi:hypothetical protein
MLTNNTKGNAMGEFLDVNDKANQDRLREQGFEVGRKWAKSVSIERLTEIAHELRAAYDADDMSGACDALADVYPEIHAFGDCDWTDQHAADPRFRDYWSDGVHGSILAVFADRTKSNDS